jgi:prepilin-type processing-associated H-X9-DG protein
MYTETSSGWLPEALVWWPGRYRMWSSEMSQLINPRSGQYVCPDDPNPMEVLASNYGPGAGVYSYAYNLRLGYANVSFPSFPGYHPAYRAARVSDLMDPTRFVAMYCAVLPYNWWFFDGPVSLWMTRHGGTTNLLMVDGHVVGRKAEDIPPPPVPEFHWGYCSLETDRW